jgi:hypothetical protein
MFSLRTAAPTQVGKYILSRIPLVWPGLAASPTECIGCSLSQPPSFDRDSMYVLERSRS